MKGSVYFNDVIESFLVLVNSLYITVHLTCPPNGNPFRLASVLLIVANDQNQCGCSESQQPLILRDVQMFEELGDPNQLEF